MNRLFTNKIHTKLILILALLFCVCNQKLLGNEAILPVLEVQKLVDNQWLMNRSLLEKLNVLRFNPYLYLYTYIETSELNHQTKNVEALQRQIDFDVKLRGQLQELKVPYFYLEDLDFQIAELRIALALNKSLIFRGQHNLTEALAQLENCLTILSSFQAKNSLPWFMPVKEYFGLVHYHKGKIYRVEAGLDPDCLDNRKLQECEKSYLRALSYTKEKAAIHGSLGFLYKDMHKNKKASEYLQTANQLDPNHPQYLYGLATLYYERGIQETENQKENFLFAEEHFRHSIELYKQTNASSGTMYLAYGKLQMFQGNLDEALIQFNQGLEKFPEHALLLIARGVLFEKLGQREKGLKDLRKGLASIKDKNLQKKYIDALDHIAREPKLLEATTQIIEHDNRSELEQFLKNCKNYGVKKAVKQPTCFISYAWGVPAQEEWVLQLAKDLESAGIHVLLDRWTIAAGRDLMGFVEKMLADETDKIIVVGSKNYLEKYSFNASHDKELERVVKVESRILNYMIRFNHFTSDKIIPILLEGTAVDSLPPLLRMKCSIDFTEKTYVHNLARLIRDIYEIDPRHPEFLKIVAELP